MLEAAPAMIVDHRVFCPLQRAFSRKRADESSMGPEELHSWRGAGKEDASFFPLAGCKPVETYLPRVKQYAD
jgi:hypothetical protein